ncbi:stage II sporulation protein M [Paenibacillus selenitireducens]|uniref:Stage II sporulation protein M n=1 Tax=Paenibacillus selenitireducens TaxID=1324314 RepID=A0A1T2XNZ8_9BACL|nr:stage II sporulation protein M [Paenibacillus selenitireducens]
MQLIRQTFRDQMNLYVFVAVLFIVGVVFGALMVNALSLEQQQELSSYVGNFIHTMDSKTTSAHVQTFWQSAFDYLKWVALIWILGLSVVGLPFILVLDFIKGVLIGFTVGLLAGQFSWKGLLFALASIAPQNMIAIPVLFIVSVAAISFSLYMIRSRVMMKRNFTMKQPFLTYMTLTTTMAVVLLGIAAFETWVSPTLMQWVAPMLPEVALKH